MTKKKITRTIVHLLVVATYHVVVATYHVTAAHTATHTAAHTATHTATHHLCNTHPACTHRDRLPEVALYHVAAARTAARTATHTLQHAHTATRTKSVSTAFLGLSFFSDLGGANRP